jgi:L-seryl-tRNA(Ser) seleniumtransferase
MTQRTLQDRLKDLPKVDVLLRHPQVEAASALHGRERVAEAVRGLVEELRQALASGAAQDSEREEWLNTLPGRLLRKLDADLESSLRGVINATGVIVHTNLGRSPLSAAALARVAAVGKEYSTLEYDLEKGTRGSRSLHAQRLLSALFPGHRAHVVNNNAAAVLLALNTFAEDKEVIVSRGELVEIGGSFRIPDVMRKGQAILREVGTTNRTRVEDYAKAIGQRTGLLLKVHTSNYRIVGFTHEASLQELVDLGRRQGIPVMVDQGGGNLLEVSQAGIRGEPSVAQLLSEGADLVSFSADKLLGGPQAGILVGREEMVRRLRDNPLSRALRVDKLTYAALEATLQAYVTGRAWSEIPVLRMMGESPQRLQERGAALADRIARERSGAMSARLLAGASVIGGGAAPLEELPTWLVAVSCAGRSAADLERSLRAGTPPVVARIQDDTLVLDLRTVFPEQEEALSRAVAALAPTR